MAFEEEFSCEIPDDIAEKIVTVKDAICIYRRKCIGYNFIKCVGNNE